MAERNGPTRSGHLISLVAIIGSLIAVYRYPAIWVGICRVLSLIALFTGVREIFESGHVTDDVLFKRNWEAALLILIGIAFASMAGWGR